MKYSLLFTSGKEVVGVGINVNKYTSKDDLLYLIELLQDVHEQTTNFRDYIALILNELVEKRKEDGWNWYFNHPDIVIDCKH